MLRFDGERAGGMGTREVLAFAAGCALFIAANLLLCHPRVLYGRPLWLDEYLTDLIVRDPSISHSIDAVRHGVDTNPPVYHLILRGIWSVAKPLGLSAPATFRVVSTLCLWLALVGTYVLLRRVVGIWPAVIGILAVWPHPDIIDQMIEARFYAPLLAASVAFALALSMPGRGPWRALLVAAAAALLCTLHYFGVAIAGLICIGNFLADDDPPSTRIIPLLPALVGPLALLPFLSFVKTQGAGLTVKTWLDPFTPRLARLFLVDVFYPLPMAIVLAAWWLARSFGPALEARPAAPWKKTAPLMAMAAITIVIVAFSATVQSALRSRYAIVAVLATAPIAAMLAISMPRWARWCAALGLALLGFTQVRGAANQQASFERILETEAADMRGDSLPILFTDRGDACALIAVAPDLFDRVRIVDLRRPGIPLRPLRLYETQMVDKVRAYYPIPPLLPVGQIHGTVHLISAPEDLATIATEIPVKPIGKDLDAVGEPAPAKDR